MDKDRSELADSLNLQRADNLKIIEELKEALATRRALQEKISILEKELTEVTALVNKFNISTGNFEKMLSFQKGASDRTGLGYVHSPSSSTDAGKTKFVKSVGASVLSKVMPSVDSGKRVVHKNIVREPVLTLKSHALQTCMMNNVRNNFPVRNFVPVCHYCGVSGHIRPKCWDLVGRPTRLRRNMSGSPENKHWQNSSVYHHRVWPLSVASNNTQMLESGSKFSEKQVDNLGLRYLISHRIWSSSELYRRLILSGGWRRLELQLRLPSPPQIRNSDVATLRCFTFLDFLSRPLAKTPPPPTVDDFASRWSLLVLGKKRISESEYISANREEISANREEISANLGRF
ncbi:hypothetical protein U1Q18_030772 [Sarracenia purpurea var. burkii]